jgi:hypothetical protein
MKKFSEEQYITQVTGLLDLILTALDKWTNGKAGKTILAEP